MSLSKIILLTAALAATAALIFINQTDPIQPANGQPGAFGQRRVQGVSGLDAASAGAGSRARAFAPAVGSLPSRGNAGRRHGN